MVPRGGASPLTHANASLARTVDGHDDAAGVSRTSGGQKERHVGDSAWPGCAPERKPFINSLYRFSSPNSCLARVFIKEM